MDSRPALPRISLAILAVILSAAQLPAPAATAMTVWNEGPAEFSRGASDNLTRGPGGLSLAAANGTDGWVNMTPSVAPSPRAGHVMVYDKAHDEFLTFGGDRDGTFLSDTWTYDAASNLWTDRTHGIPPPPRGYYSLAIDPARGKVVMFGGYDSLGPLGDTWVYDTSTRNWTDMTTSPAPSARHGAAMACDPVSGIFFLFGGDDGKNRFGDTWTYDPCSGAWTEKGAIGGIRARAGHDMVYDGKHRVFILFGGMGGMLKLLPDIYNDTWMYDPGTNAWTERRPDSRPYARYNHALAYDGRTGAIVLFGGRSPFNLDQDTWTYDPGYNAWTERGPATVPAARCAHAMAYDGSRGLLVMFGGHSGTEIRGDTWTYELRTYRQAGVFTSVPRGADCAKFFGSISWWASMPAGTYIRFQLRGGQTEEEMETFDFSGPDGTANSFYAASGERVSSPMNGSRWLQYRVFMGTDDINASPVLHNLRLDFNIRQTVVIKAPVEGDRWSGVQTVAWFANDPDLDGMRYDLGLLGPDGAETPLASGQEAMEWKWNTREAANGTYRIKLSARDDNPAIPLAVSAISGNFTVSNPYRMPPNHPPHVSLVSPEWGALLSPGTVRLRWHGSDPDGDAILYTISCWDDVISIGNLTTSTSNCDFLDLANLSVNVIYFWTVDASDGKAGHAYIPAGVRWFRLVEIPVVPEIAPTCAITSPADNSTLGGNIEIRGTAAGGTRPLARVRIRFDGGEWMNATGLDSWSFCLDSAELGNGKHIVEAQAFDANLSSATAAARFTVFNPGPMPSAEGVPWCLAALILPPIVVAAGLMAGKRGDGT